jgi:hypothetical protein
MAFTYAGDPANSQLEAVRFHCGDTDADQQLLNDAEINYVIGLAPNTFMAAADACEAIAAKFTRKIDRSNTGQSASLSAKSEQYRKMAQDLRRRASTDSDAFAGGLTISGKEALSEDSDAVQPDFELGMDDRTRPADLRDSRFIP